MSISSMLIHRCDVETQVTTKTQTGGVVTTWETKAASVPCFFTRMSPSVAQVYAHKFDVSQGAVCYFNTNAVEPIKDRIVFEGKQYQVHDMRNQAGRSRVWRADVEGKR